MLSGLKVLWDICLFIHGHNWNSFSLISCVCGGGVEDRERHRERVPFSVSHFLSHRAKHLKRFKIFKNLNTPPQKKRHSMFWCKSLGVKSEVIPTKMQTYIHFGEKIFLIETKIHDCIYTGIRGQYSPNCPSWACSNKPTERGVEAIHCKILVVTSFTDQD